jgi:hypothetical protein
LVAIAAQAVGLSAKAIVPAVPVTPSSVRALT